MKNYQQLGSDLGKLVDEKQAAYGDSFGNAGKILAALYPNGVRPDQMDDMLAIVRIVDKMFRIANQKDAFNENPFKDIAGYGLLGMAAAENRPSEKQNILEGIYRKERIIPGMEGVDCLIPIDLPQAMKLEGIPEGQPMNIRLTAAKQNRGQQGDRS